MVGGERDKTPPSSLSPSLSASLRAAASTQELMLQISRRETGGRVGSGPREARRVGGQSEGRRE